MIPERGRRAVAVAAGPAVPAVAVATAVCVLGAFGVLAPALAPGTAGAVTKLEGEYQLMLDVRKDQRFFPWDWDSNNTDNFNSAQLRLFSQPRPNVEAFVKVEAEWRNPENQNPRPEFQYREAHLRYRWDLQGKGLDSYLFSRQDRFWVENHLIRVVDGNTVKNDRFGPNAQGIRLDTWGFLGLNTTWIASDFSDQYNPAGQDTTFPAAPDRSPSPMLTDDAYIVRVRRELLDKNLRLGATYTRRIENERNEPLSQADVFAYDARFQFRGVDYSLEYARSRAMNQNTQVTYPDALDRALPNRSVLVAEIRALRFGNAKVGFLNLAPLYWDRGPLWENRLGDSNRDERGFKVDSWYLVPQRAITLTSSYGQWKSSAHEKREDNELYNEIYIEFVNGFTGKAFLRNYDIRRDFGGQITLEEHDDLFFETSVESRLAWLRVQGKIKDVDQPSQKELFALETSVNLTDKLKVYNRFTFGNDPGVLRKGIFSQLQYRPTGNMEMFLEYGPGWIGDSQRPVDDGDVEGGGDQVDLFKFILKGQF